MSVSFIFGDHSAPDKLGVGFLLLVRGFAMKLLLFVVLVVFLPPATPTADCVCVKEPHPSEEKVKADRRQAYDKATAVFEGKVVALDSYAVTFILQKRWKGYSQNEVVLSTGAVPGYEGTPLPEECSYQFQLGEEYLVYAYGAGEKLKAPICSTLMIKNAAAEEKGLDQIKTHETIREKSNEQAQDCFLADTKSKSAWSGLAMSELLWWVAWASR